MTVAELIKELQALPQDIQIMMLDSDRESPVEIVQVSRGTWGADLAEEQEELRDDEIAEEYWEQDQIFKQDDDNGKIVVLVTW
jgi:hypothetical protein